MLWGSGWRCGVLGWVERIVILSFFRMKGEHLYEESLCKVEKILSTYLVAEFYTVISVLFQNYFHDLKFKPTEYVRGEEVICDE